MVCSIIAIRPNIYHLEITCVAPANKKNRSSRISLMFTAWLAGMGSGLALISFFYE